MIDNATFLEPRSLCPKTVKRHANAPGKTGGKQAGRGGLLAPCPPCQKNKKGPKWCKAKGHMEAAFKLVVPPEGAGKQGGGEGEENKFKRARATTPAHTRAPTIARARPEAARKRARAIAESRPRPAGSRGAARRGKSEGQKEEEEEEAAAGSVKRDGERDPSSSGGDEWRTLCAEPLSEREQRLVAAARKQVRAFHTP